jgi:hypothetical protein
VWDKEMRVLLDNEQIAFGIELLEKVTRVACEPYLRSGGGDKPDLCIKAVPFIEYVVEMIDFGFDLKLIFLPTD